MRRDLSAFDGAMFDLLVIGGGVVGASIARDAALRGLRTALVEGDDFGAGASANCLKIVHGGLRYLQHLDLVRMRESIRERSFWLAAAPHLVQPLPIVMPTQRGRFPPKTLLTMAAAANDVISADRNRGLLDERRLPRGRTLSRDACVAAVPELASTRLTGGLLFHDALMYSPERLVLETVMAAAAAGAQVANHLEVTAPRIHGGHIDGVLLRDRLDDERIEVRARRIVIAAGAWTPRVAALLQRRPTPAAPAYSVAINFVAPGMGHDVAFAIAGGTPDPDRVVPSTNRQLFLVPWRGHTLIGTAHAPFDGDPASFRVSDEQIDAFRREVATATPAVPLSLDDIDLVHAGLLPVASSSSASGVRLLKRAVIHSHAAEGAPELISVFSIKFTTARRLAEDVVDRVLRDTGVPASASRTATVPLPGGAIGDFDALRRAALARFEGPADILEHLLRTYGTRYDDVLACRNELDGWNERVVQPAPVIRAQLLHAARTEMAYTVDDLLRRRTELGPRGLITPAADSLARQILRLAHGTAAHSVARAESSVLPPP